MDKTSKLFLLFVGLIIIKIIVAKMFIIPFR